MEIDIKEFINWINSVNDMSYREVAYVVMVSLALFINFYRNRSLFFSKPKIGDLAKIICEKLDTMPWQLKTDAKDNLEIYNNKYLLKIGKYHNTDDVNYAIFHLLIEKESYDILNMLQKHEIKIIKSKFNKILDKLRLEKEQKEKIEKENSIKNLIKKLQFEAVTFTPSSNNGYAYHAVLSAVNAGLSAVGQEFLDAIINGKDKLVGDYTFYSFNSNKKYAIKFENKNFIVSKSYLSNDDEYYDNKLQEWEKLFLIDLAKKQKV